MIVIQTLKQILIKTMELLKKKYKLKSRSNLINPPLITVFQESSFKNFTLRAASLSSPNLPKASSNTSLSQISPIKLKNLNSSSSPKNPENYEARSGTLCRKRSKNWLYFEKVKKLKPRSDIKNDQLNIEIKDFWMGNSFAKIGIIGKNYTRKSNKLPFISKKFENQKETKESKNDTFLDYNEPYIKHILIKKRGIK